MSTSLNSENPDNFQPLKSIKPVSYWWIFIWYSPAILFTLASVIFAALTPGATLFEIVRPLFYLASSWWIAYLLFLAIKIIRNRQRKKKNLKWPVLITTFVLPLFILSWLWSFTWILYIIYKADLAWRLDLPLASSIQIALSFVNAWFLWRKNLKWILLNTATLIVSLILSSFLEDGFDNKFFIIPLIALFLIGLVDLSFYVYYYFREKKKSKNLPIT